MINKQSLWFVTLFSMILVLSIYYVTMKDDYNSILKTEKNNNTKEVSLTESSYLVSLRVADDEEVLAQMQELQTILLDESASLQEKNDAYESLQTINMNKGKEADIEEKIKKEFNLDSFVKIKNDRISVTIDSNKHDMKLANKIMTSIQKLYEIKMYITVKFQK